jgi:hypothetical protein
MHELPNSTSNINEQLVSNIDSKINAKQKNFHANSKTKGKDIVLSIYIYTWHI